MTISRAEGTAKVRRRRALRRRRVLITAGPVLLVLLLCAAWVGTRAYISKGELEAAAPLVSQIQDQLTTDDGAAAKVTADLLASHSSSAASLTSDPVWKVMELAPWLGPNLKAIASVSAAVNDVAINVIEPLASMANGISISDFKPVAGAVTLQPFIDAQPLIQGASNSLESANSRVQAINTTQTLGSVSDATSRFAAMLQHRAPHR